MLKRLVASGMGIGVIPREYVQNSLQEKTLYQLTTDPVLPVRSVGMLLPKHGTMTYALRCFLSLFNIRL